MNASTDRSLQSIFFIPFVLAIVALFFFLALLHGQRDLTVLSMLLLSIAVLAKLWSRRSLKEISCSLTLDKYKLFPDETLLLQATVENRKILPVWLRLSAPVSGGIHGGPAFRERLRSGTDHKRPDHGTGIACRRDRAKPESAGRHPGNTGAAPDGDFLRHPRIASASDGRRFRHQLPLFFPGRG
jgi:hypothetical protein